ncbi:MAG: YtxH domain-containing protein [Desulfovibrionales bacterium]|nr:YtxH domain-containing protein [Desulfovibrionales bacterium]
MDDTNKEVKIIGAFLLGGIVGAGLALLLAPQSGKRTREDITRIATKAKRRAEDVAEDAAHTVKNVIYDVGELLSDVVGHGKDLTEDVKKKLLGAIEEGQKSFEEQKTKILKMVKK